MDSPWTLCVQAVMLSSSHKDEDEPSLTECGHEGSGTPKPSVWGHTQP